MFGFSKMYKEQAERLCKSKKNAGSMGCYRRDQQGGLRLGDVWNRKKIPVPDIVLANGSSRDQGAVGSLSLLRVLTTYDANIGVLISDLKLNKINSTMRWLHDWEMSIV